MRSPVHKMRSAYHSLTRMIRRIMRTIRCITRMVLILFCIALLVYSVIHLRIALWDGYDPPKMPPLERLVHLIKWALSFCLCVILALLLKDGLCASTRHGNSDSSSGGPGPGPGPGSIALGSGLYDLELGTMEPGTGNNPPGASQPTHGSGHGSNPVNAAQLSPQARSPLDLSMDPHDIIRNAFFNVLIIHLLVIQFVSSRGNEYFCEIDEDYLTDRFNLTGLNTEVSYYQYALDLVTDVFDLDADDDLREQIEKSARHLYGLVHARYIVTTRGLAKMLEKYKKSDFGKCPRVMCDGHALLPIGQSDLANMSTVKLYCPKCEDIYNPKSSRHASIDGAYFGTSFHSILFQVYPALNPEKSCRRYEPRIYGFKVHAAAALARYQDGEREDLKMRLAEADIQHRFIEDSESDDDAFQYDQDYPEGRAETAKAQTQVGDAAPAMEIGN